MSLSVEPDLYQVAVDENGTYINAMPSLNNIKNGIRCPCGSRKNQVYKTTASLTKHFDCEKHKTWLKNLNHEKINHYNDLIKTREVFQQQQQMIRDLKIELQEKDRIIINLNKDINKLQKPTYVPVVNLLDL